MEGFSAAQNNLLSFYSKQQYSKLDDKINRIIMLTDVEDNSVQNAGRFIEEVSNSLKIHTTIIGISDSFVSQTCEKLNQIEGFNYFCATEVNDLKKYLFENFSFTFFPSNYDIQIELIDNKNIKSIEVFGTVDAKKVKQYNDRFQKINDKVVITKTKTSFPSQIQVTNQGILKQFGGLIIVKLEQKDPQKNKFQAKIRMSYKNSKGQKEQNIYPVSFEFPQKEQFYSQQCLAEAMPAFYYVYEVRKILQQKKNSGSIQNTERHVGSLEKLRGICPKSKLKELQDLIKVLKEEIQNKKKSPKQSPIFGY